MRDDQESRLIRAAIADARALGYLLLVDEAPNLPSGLAWTATAVPQASAEPSMGRWLCHAPTRVDAAQAGLDVIRGVVLRGEAWPAEPT